MGDYAMIASPALIPPRAVLYLKEILPLCLKVKRQGKPALAADRQVMG